MTCRSDTFRVSTVSQQESARAAWERAHRAAKIAEDARKAAGLSIRAAARLVPQTDAWWAAAVRGDRSAGHGQRIEVIAPDETLVRMAAAVGVEREVREALGLEIPDHLIARSPEDDPDIEVTIKPPAEYFVLSPEARAYVDALTRRMAAEEQERLRRTHDDPESGER